MADLTYLSCPEDVFKGNIDFDTDTFYGMLVTDAYTPNQDTHDRRDDVSNEVVGTGYTAGGQAITVSSVAKDTGANTITVNFASHSWASSTITARGEVIYKRRGGASSADELVAYNDFGSDITSSGAAFNVAASTLTLTVTV
jgi:hypothetical protein